jgi:hypothetical protein
MGVSGQHHDPTTLRPVPTVPQCRSGRVRKISAPTGFDPWAVQSVAHRYTDYAISAHLNKGIIDLS